MPKSKKIDEATWERAKKEAGEGASWALVQHVYQKMKKACADGIKKSLVLRPDDLMKAEGERGGHVIGHTKSGKPIYASKSGSPLSHEEHTDSMKEHKSAMDTIKGRLREHLHGKKKMKTSDVHAAVDAHDAHGEAWSAHEAMLRHEPGSTGKGIDKRRNKADEASKKAHQLHSKVDMKKSTTDDLQKATVGEGSRGGKIVGHTAAGKPIYAHSEKAQIHHEEQLADHNEVAKHHASKAGPKGMFGPGKHHALAEAAHVKAREAHRDAQEAHRKKTPNAHELSDKATKLSKEAHAKTKKVGTIKQKRFQKSESNMSDDFYKSLVKRGEDLQKGIYPSSNVTDWANQFYGSPHRVEALKLLKEKGACEEERDKALANEKTWREIENMALEARTQYRNERQKTRDTYNKKLDAIRAKQTALETKLIDHQIAQAEREASMLGKSQTDDLQKAGMGEGTRGGVIVGHDAAGKPVYASKKATRHILKIHHEGEAEEHRAEVRKLHKKRDAATKRAEKKGKRSDAAALYHTQAGFHEEAAKAHQKAYNSHLHDHPEAEKHSVAASKASKKTEGFKKSTTDDLQKATVGEGARGGKVIGHTAGGKPIYEGTKDKHGPVIGRSHVTKLPIHSEKPMSDAEKKKLAEHHAKATHHSNMAEKTRTAGLKGAHMKAVAAHSKAVGSIVHGRSGAEEHSKAAHGASKEVKQVYARLASQGGLQASDLKKSFDHQTEGLPFNISDKPTDDMSKSYTHGQTSFGAGELLDEMVDIKQAGANGGMPDEDVKKEREKVYHEPETVVVEHAGSNSPYGKAH